VSPAQLLRFRSGVRFLQNRNDLFFGYLFDFIVCCW